MNKLLVALLLVCASVDSANAQEDTIQFRYLNSALPDSTLFNFEFGQIAFWNGYELTYVGFEESTGDLSQNHFTSQVFTPNWSSDTLAFTRWASFDDRSYKFSGAALDSAAVDSLVAAWDQYYDTLQFRPSNSYFNSNSRIDYITELRRSSDGSILIRLDTLTCYLNLAGELRYRTPDNTFATRVFDLDEVLSGGTGSVYLTVTQQSTLPQGVGLVHRGRESKEQGPLNGAFAGSFQEFIYPAMKPISASATSARIDEPKVVTKRDGVTTLELNSKVSGDLVVDIIEIATGIPVISENIRIGIGKIEKTIWGSFMAPDRYLVRVTDGVRSFVCKPITRF